MFKHCGKAICYIFMLQFSKLVKTIFKMKLNTFVTIYDMDILIFNLVQAINHKWPIMPLLYGLS